MRRLAAGLALTTLVAVAQAQDTDARERTLRRHAEPGTETRIYTYTQHRRDCTALGLPSINVSTNPVHGTVSVRADSIVVGDPPRFGGPDCRGKRLDGLGVFYTPAAGFTGRDRFDWYVIFTNGTGHDTAIVTVAPPGTP